MHEASKQMGEQDLFRQLAGQCLAVRVRLINRAVTGIYDSALRPFGLRVSQMNLLVAIGYREDVSPSELSARLCVDESTVSRNIDRMIERGWIRTIGQTDRRAHHLQLTDVGRELIKRARPAWEKAQKRVQESLGVEATSAILRTGNRFIREGIAGEDDV